MKGLRTIALAFGPWCGGFAIGYLLIAIPVLGLLALLSVAGYGIWRATAGRRRPVRVPGWFLLVWVLLVLSTLLGFAGGAGFAAHGAQNPWAGLMTASFAWLIAQIARTVES